MRAAPDIAYASRTDGSPEAELSALANIYKFVLAKKEAAPRQSRPDDAERNPSDSASIQSTS
jgi:hypothetical protein